MMRSHVRCFYLLWLMVFMFSRIFCEEIVLRALVLLPHRTGDFKLPFGAEMSGAAGKFMFSLYLL